MTARNKKAQIISFDFSLSFIVFIIFIVVFIFLIFFNNNTETKQEFELDYIFANLENNLKYYSVPNTDFFMNYRINQTNLGNFALDFDDKSIDSFVIGNITGTHGIGLDDGAYDVCLYFTDNDNTRIVLITGPPDIIALGWLDEIETGPRSCSDVLTDSENPCESYSQAISLFKPVLFDYGDEINNRIVQMNIVLCKK